MLKEKERKWGDSEEVGRREGEWRNVSKKMKKINSWGLFNSYHSLLSKLILGLQKVEWVRGGRQRTRIKMGSDGGEEGGGRRAGWIGGSLSAYTHLGLYLFSCLGEMNALTGQRKCRGRRSRLFPPLVRRGVRASSRAGRPFRSSGLFFYSRLHPSGKSDACKADVIISSLSGLGNEAAVVLRNHTQTRRSILLSLEGREMIDVECCGWNLRRQ